MKIIPEEKRTLRGALKNAVMCRCPNCGKGKLFASYLKQVDNCSVCDESFKHIRADDGPAWLTILIVGHILVPIALIVMAYTNWPDWLHVSIWSVLTIIMSIALLPSAKAVFISIIWRSGCEGSS